VFTAADFTDAKTADTTASNGYEYSIKVTVHDAESSVASNIYTIGVNVENNGHNPYLKDTTETDLGSWTIGHPLDTITILPSLWKDDDPNDVLTFDSTSSSKCSIT